MARRVNGMQVSFPLELVDEGIEKSLDFMKARDVNSLFLLSHIDYQDSSYWGKLTHNPKRDRIISEGFFYEPRREYYEKTRIKPVRTRDRIMKTIDIFEQIPPLAHARGMKCYGFMVNRFPNAREHADCAVRDVMNQPLQDVLCLNNAEVRSLFRGVITDLITSYEIDGIFLDLLDHAVQFGFTKLPDELVEIVGSVELQKPEMGLTCFCEECRKLAQKDHLDSDRIRKGLVRAIENAWIPGKIQDMSSADEAIRFVTEFPEYLEWLRFRAEHLADFHKELYSLTKSLNSKAEVVLDIYGPSQSWKYAADFRQLSRHCDWIKAMFYSGTYPAPPLTPQRVNSETKKAIEEVESAVDIVAGINAISQTPEYVRESVVECLKAGSKGAIISWDYGLIPFENMTAAREGFLAVPT